MTDITNSEAAENTVRDAMMAYMLDLDRQGRPPPSYAELIALFGCSSTPIRCVVYAFEQIKKDRAKAVPDISAAPPHWKERCERFMRTWQKQAEATRQGEISDHIAKHMRNYLLPSLNEKLEHYNAVINARKGLMPRSLFRKILACLHPDQSMSDATKREMFEAWQKLERVVVSAAELPQTPSRNPLPATVEEFHAMRVKAEAERRAKAAARKAAKGKPNNMAAQG